VVEGYESDIEIREVENRVCWQCNMGNKKWEWDQILVRQVGRKCGLKK